MKRKNIGLFGGTFDPIHFGHLNIAFELMEKHHLDEVWFIPVQMNPLKTKMPPTPIKQRIEMVQLAIQDIPSFMCSDIETRLPPPSYTINTLHAILAEDKKNPIPHQFFFLMGEDAVEGFYRWHKPEEIIATAPILIGSRTGETDSIMRNYQDKPLFYDALNKGFTPIRLVEISATDIRNRLARHLYCGHLLPAPVLYYIQENFLYLS